MKIFNSYCKQLMWFFALLLTAFTLGCGGGGGQDPILGGVTVVLVPPAGAIAPGGVCPVAGPTIPTVTSTDPTNGNQFVTTSTSGVAGGGKAVTATFSLPMAPATINSATFALAPTGGAALIPASVTYNPATRVATLTTSSALLANTAYTAVILQGATSATGVPMGCSYTWAFKTAAAAAAGPAPVNLGLATPFAIAARAGVTNDLATPPNTTINGNVVLHLTATCNAVAVDTAGGFGPCGGLAPILNGQVISPLFPDPGTTSGAVMADLRAAYNSILPANLPGATVLGCGVIGTGGGAGAGPGCAGNATLPAGVYISATSSSIGVTGVLTLDGGGDANARFIFQAPSTLTTAAGALGAPGSEIRLINGAKASNVFWQVGSSATIGTFALFQGNVLADTSITMGDQSTSCGRLLAGAVTATGAFVFDGNVVSVPGHANAPPACQ